MVDALSRSFPRLQKGRPLRCLICPTKCLVLPLFLVTCELSRGDQTERTRRLLISSAILLSCLREVISEPFGLQGLKYRVLSSPLIPNFNGSGFITYLSGTFFQVPLLMSATYSLSMGSPNSGCFRASWNELWMRVSYGFDLKDIEECDSA